MGSKLSAHPDALLTGSAEKATFDLRGILSRSSSVQTATPSWWVVFFMFSIFILWLHCLVMFVMADRHCLHQQPVSTATTDIQLMIQNLHREELEIIEAVGKCSVFSRRCWCGWIGRWWMDCSMLWEQQQWMLAQWMWVWCLWWTGLHCWFEVNFYKLQVLSLWCTPCFCSILTLTFPDGDLHLGFWKSASDSDVITAVVWIMKCWGYHS